LNGKDFKWPGLQAHYFFFLKRVIHALCIGWCTHPFINETIVQSWQFNEHKGSIQKSTSEKVVNVVKDWAN
jgi:hypothetical protein